LNGLTLSSDLWLDRPDVDALIEDRLRRAELSPAQADALQRFARDG